MTNKVYQFKLDGIVYTVALQHTSDLKKKQVMLNGTAVGDVRQSKINPNDLTFTIDGHFCIAQFRESEDGFAYDMLIDGRSLEARRQKRETSTVQRKEMIQSRQPAAASKAASSNSSVKSIQSKSQGIAQAAAQISAQVSTRPQSSSARSSLLTKVMSEEDTVVDKKRLMTPAQAQEARQKLRSGSQQKSRHMSQEMRAVQIAEEDDLPYEMPASFRTFERPQKEETPYWVKGELYAAEEAKSDAVQERETKTSKVNKQIQTGTMPAWTWLFMVACGLIPVAAVGGVVAGVLGSAGVAICASIACSRKSVVLRVALCLFVTAACWGAMIATNGTQISLT